MLGTLVNVATVIVGSLIGLALKRNMPEKIQKLIFEILGLFTVLLGLKMAFESNNVLLLLLSLIFGGLIGELLNIDHFFIKLGDYIKRKFNSKESKFTEGLVSSFLLFCIGPLTILGCLEEGLGNYPTQLLTKATMDGFSSMALASALGIGVLVSVIPLFIFQTSLTFLAIFIEPYITENMLTELTACGGMMILALGLNILELKNIKVANLLPALLISAFASYFIL